MSYLSLLPLLLLLLTILPMDAQAQKPSRRELIQQGEQHLLDRANTIRNNAKEGLVITYKNRTMPQLGYSFDYPELWTVGITQEHNSKLGQYYTSDGDYVYINEQQLDESYTFFISSKLYDNPTTLADAWNEWNAIKKQPDFDNVYQTNNSAFIRELKVLAETEIEFLGVPALQLEYTFNNWSTFWKSRSIRFPWGNRIYTITYRAELIDEDRFLDAYHHLLESFAFFTPVQQDVEVEQTFTDLPTSHQNKRAIERLQELSLLQGYSDGSVRPNATINRAEFIKIITSQPLVTAEELAACTDSSFPDVPADSWFAPHVCVAFARHMIGGYPDGTFRPEQTISFVEAAKIVSTFFAEADTPENTDVTEQWFLPFVRSLERRHAIPLSISSFSSPLTRGEMSEMIYRLYDNLQEPSQSVEDLQ